eukprot:m.61405 g.61405  ORF g.61405 m.61405 type:complete len:118 (-) comp12345_c0_seq2:46-399(-)
MSKRSEKEREELERERISQVLGATFAAQAKELSSTEDMEKYIQARLAGQSAGANAKEKSEYERMYEALFHVPEHLKTKKPAQKPGVNRGFSSRAVPTEVEEVSLPSAASSTVAKGQS